MRAGLHRESERVRKGKSGQNRKRMCERRKLAREKIHTLKIIRTGRSVRVVCAAREIYREKRAPKGKSHTLAVFRSPSDENKS